MDSSAHCYAVGTHRVRVQSCRLAEHGPRRFAKRLERQPLFQSVTVLVASPPPRNER
jgi:hypothetical protein